eukprot:6204204-Pleurochrysis_carterae.AAC.1
MTSTEKVIFKREGSTIIFASRDPSPAAALDHSDPALEVPISFCTHSRSKCGQSAGSSPRPKRVHAATADYEAPDNLSSSASPKVASPPPSPPAARAVRGTYFDRVGGTYSARVVPEQPG